MEPHVRSSRTWMASCLRCMARHRGVTTRMVMAGAEASGAWRVSSSQGHLETGSVSRSSCYVLIAPTAHEPSRSDRPHQVVEVLAEDSQPALAADVGRQ